ncbi:MAG: NAD-glutamate dehydrogenase, partial [Sphingomonadales bacterium]|nr:NAD-glutamate dehydrogenase [Sphingomonadales bacterium]
MNTWERKADIIRQLQALALSEMDKKEADDLARFIDGFYTSSAPNDLVNTPIDELFGQTLAMWKLARDRRPGTTRIKVFNPTKMLHGWKSSHTFIMVVHDDMPFLVDSITAELTNKMKAAIYTLHHPVFYVEREKNG